MEPVRNGPTAKGIASWSEYRQNLLREREEFDNANRARIRQAELRPRSLSRHEERARQLGANMGQYRDLVRVERDEEGASPFQLFWANMVKEHGFVDGSNLAHKLNDEFGDDSDAANAFYEERVSEKQRSITTGKRNDDREYHEEMHDDSEAVEYERKRADDRKAAYNNYVGSIRDKTEDE